VSQTLTKLIVHAVFSTKNRANLIASGKPSISKGLCFPFAIRELKSQGVKSKRET